MKYVCIFVSVESDIYCFRQNVAHVTDRRMYRQISNISRTLVGNYIVDHPDVVGTSPVRAAPTTSLFSTQHLASIYCAKATAIRYENISA